MLQRVLASGAKWYSLNQIIIYAIISVEYCCLSALRAVYLWHRYYLQQQQQKKKKKKKKKQTKQTSSATVTDRSRHLAPIGTVEKNVKPQNEPPHDKPPKWLCAQRRLDQPGHPPGLIRVFTVRMKKAWILSSPMSAQRRLWSDWADAQAELSLRWANMSFSSICRAAAQIWTYKSTACTATSFLILHSIFT